MNQKTKTALLWSGMALFVGAGVLLLTLSFGGAEGPTPTDVEAVYTNAALTVAAQQQTMAALTPTASPSPLPSFVPPPSPTLPIGTPALQPIASVPPSTLAVGCDNAVYAADATIPDGTNIPGGQSFVKTWRVLNNGSCAWNPNYQLVYVGGDVLGGRATPIGLSVPPGAVVEVSVTLTAPYTQGKFTGQWRLANDKGVPFGDVLTVVINTGPTPTPTFPVETAAPTDAPTEEPPTATPTEEPTITPASP